MVKTKILFLYKLLLVLALTVVFVYGPEIIPTKSITYADKIYDNNNDDNSDDSDDDSDDDKKNKETVIKGVVSTGANIYLGNPLWDFGDPWGTLGFTSVGGFNSNGDDPLVLSSDSPADTLLASSVAPQLLALFELEVPQNTLLRKNFTVINGSGTRGQLPAVTEVKGSSLSKSLPNGPITLGEWMKASAKAKFLCKEDGTAMVEIKFKGLIENGLYSVWATYGDPDTGGLAPVPLGGTPNIIVPGSEGKAIFKRFLNDCPLTPVPGERPLLLIEVAYHSDGMIYGGVADLPNAGFPFGLTTHTHISFPIIVESIF